MTLLVRINSQVMVATDEIREISVRVDQGQSPLGVFVVTKSCGQHWVDLAHGMTVGQGVDLLLGRIARANCAVNQKTP